MIDVLTSVGADQAAGTVPDSPASAWRHSFPTADLVEAAAGMFTGHRVTDRRLGITLDGLDVATPSGIKGRELFPRSYVGAGASWEPAMIEGPRWYVTISPGTVAVRSSDPARRERTLQRLARSKGAGGDAWDSNDAVRRRALMAGEDRPPGSSTITAWSSKSRSRMVSTIQSLDWAPLLAGGAVPAMVTLTYPGDWESVAPHADESRRQLLLLRKRFERAWGVRWRAVWKREFQLRGAPHWHLLCVPPTGTLNGERFPEWLSRVWAEVVGSESCGADQAVIEAGRIVCCERHRHRAAGTGVDYAKGLRATDPRRIAVYFSKHGAFADKEAQNQPPALWVEHGSVGRFWGVWGLDRATAGVEVSPDEALDALRMLRRHSRANAYVARVPLWRHRTIVDQVTGEVSARWRKSSKRTRVYRLANQRGGFVATSDGPALASSIARALDARYRPPARRPGEPRPLP